MGEDVAAAQDVTAMDPDHYQIEAIVAKQKAGSGHQYFLKWLNWPDSENTWGQPNVWGRQHQTWSQLTNEATVTKTNKLPLVQPGLQTGLCSWLCSKHLKNQLMHWKL